MNDSSHEVAWKYLPLSKIPEAPFGFSKGQIEWFARNRHANGFDACLRYIGGRFFVNIEEFLRWIESHKIEQKKAKLEGRLA